MCLFGAQENLKKQSHTCRKKYENHTAYANGDGYLTGYGGGTASGHGTSCCCGNGFVGYEDWCGYTYGTASGFGKDLGYQGWGFDKP